MDDNASPYMQKKINMTIYTILALTTISVIISAILLHPFTYSLKNSHKNNANMVPISLAGSNYNKQILLPFLTYQDPIYGIKIQYPSDWEKIQADGNFIIGFVSSSKQVSGLLPNLMITVLKSHSPSTSLNDFGNARISNLESQYHDFHLVSSGSFTTSLGSPVYKIEYTHMDDKLPITTTEVWSLKGNEAIMLLANVGTSESSTYMPIFQKMINSFSSTAFFTSQSKKENIV
ncbi:MAG TPA: PsbP-related protein [Nitrososphaeraceae archaeon]